MYCCDVCKLLRDYCFIFFFFFFNDTATTEIYTLSLHDALPSCVPRRATSSTSSRAHASAASSGAGSDRKSTRLNSSHPSISYAVFCLKKKNKNTTILLNETKIKKHY